MRRTLITILLLLTTIVASAKFAPAMSPVVNHTQRKKELTPLSHVQMVRSLRDSHVTLFGDVPTTKRLACAWAQVALENGRGKLVWNHNLGNIGPSKNGDVLWYMHSPGVRYRAFEGYHDGGLAYWRVLSRCSSALRSFDHGNTIQASEDLKRCNYYSTNVEHYVKGLTILYWHALNDIIPEELEEARRVGQN